jgi:PAS domain S-box-containing protein
MTHALRTQRGLHVLETHQLRDPNIAAHYLDIVGVIVLVLDSDGNIEFINRKGRNILGDSDDADILGRSWIDFIPERLRPQLREAFRRLYSGTDPAMEYYENPVLTKNGEERIIAWHNTHLVDRAGAIVATLSSGEDITERRLVEKHLQAANEKLTTIFDSVVDGIFVVAVDSGRFIDANLSGCTMFGCTSKEIVGSDIGMLSSGNPPYTLDAAIAVISRAETGLPQFVEWQCRRKDGHLFWADISMRQVSYGDRPVVLASVRDVTERKLAQEELRRSMERTVEAVASTVEARDPYTAGHEKRVAALAVAIARDMDMMEPQIDGIKFAGIVHDVGKVRIPAEILTKPGRLLREEFDLLKTHARAGYDILKDVQLPWPVATIVLQHHERIDGSGYPNGTKGNELLIESKIVAVADVVESMSYPRPYRMALGLDAALAEIQRGRGRWYESAVVDACCSVFRSGAFRFAGM